MLREKYQERVKQYVIFMGRRSPRMATQLTEDMINYRFTLVDIRQLDYRSLLDEATQPEEVVLAILSNFKKSEIDTIMPEILRKLISLTNNKRKLRRYVRQLEILSNLRDIQALTIKHTEAMSITYNIETDARYQQGIEKGIEKGKETEKEEMIAALLRSGLLTDEQITQVANASLARVRKIKAQITKK